LVEGKGFDQQSPKNPNDLGESTPHDLRQKRADREFAVIWNRDRDAARVGPPLHDD
jgi:hypothetical protein